MWCGIVFFRDPGSLVAWEPEGQRAREPGSQGAREPAGSRQGAGRDPVGIRIGNYGPVIYYINLEPSQNNGK